MSFTNKITNDVTSKIGNKVLNIEEIKEKSNIPTTKAELKERHRRAMSLVKKKSLLSSV